MHHIIINPASRSGKGMKIWHQLLPILQQDKVAFQPYLTEKVGDATTIAKALTTGLTAPIRIIILGGDGTINEVLQGIQNFPLTHLAYLPTGSSNDFARDLNLETNPVKALEKILHTDTLLEMDLGVLSCKRGYYDLNQVFYQEEYQRYFNISSGIGFDAAVCEKALSSKIKNTLNHLGLGKLTYLGIALSLLLKGGNTDCVLTLDDAPPVRLPKLLFAAAMNHRYEGGGFLFAPDASHQDARLNLCAAHSLSFQRALRILPTAFSGNHLHFPEVYYHAASKIHLTTSIPLCVHTDGEVQIYANDIQFEITNHKLNLIPTYADH